LTHHPEIAFNERLHAMDALRAVAMLLGVVLHVELAYLTVAWPPWPADDAAANPIFDYSLTIIHLFRMELFFMMAGFFGCMLLARYGVRRFIRHRVQRIVAPWALSMLTIIPVIHLLNAWGQDLKLPADEQAGLQAAAAEHFGALTVDGALWPWHLWFLEQLIVLYTLALVCSLIVKRSAALHGATERLSDGWSWCIERGLTAPVLAVLTFGGLQLQPGTGADLQMGAIPPPHISAYYLIFFLTGWLLYRRRDALPGLARFWILMFAAGVALGMWYHQLSIRPATGEQAAGSLMLLRALAACSTGSLIVGFSGLFLHLFQKPSRVMRYVSDSAYWVYLIHLPLVIWICILLQPVESGAITKFTIAMVASCAVMYLSYHFCVRHTWIGLLLNGPRIRKERLDRRSAAAASAGAPVVAGAPGATEADPATPTS
jgi:peptidoglycan/LPS O-acetylase OafA/YrhL